MPTPRASPRKPNPKPLQFGKPEKRSWPLMVMGYVFILICIYAIAYLMHRNPPMRSLECDTTGGSVSLTGFGRCHEASEGP